MIINARRGQEFLISFFIQRTLDDLFERENARKPSRFESVLRLFPKYVFLEIEREQNIPFTERRREKKEKGGWAIKIAAKD